MDSQSFGIRWIQHNADMKSGTGSLILHDGHVAHVDDDGILSNGVVTDSSDATAYLVDNGGEASTEADIDKIAAENLIFMARDGQMVTEIIAAGTDANGAVVVTASDGTTIDCEAVMHQAVAMCGQESMQLHNESGDADGYSENYNDTTPQMVTEEIITDDWVQHQGEERVEIPADQIIGSSSQVLLDIEVPLPTVQDEYTALRPYPCDFCSRRFRKKGSLLNHMVMHQNDRPHLCKLCGSRFFRRTDLISHLAAHAEAPNPEFDDVDQEWSVQPDSIVIPTKSSRKSHSTSGSSSTTSTNTNATGIRGRVSRLKPKEEHYDYGACHAAIELGQEQLTVVELRYPVIDDSKPFVCQQCGLAFAREKALLSHSKNHRNDSLYECNQCNEMFWDATNLQEHQKSHQFEESNSEYDPAEADETHSEGTESETVYGEYYCSECGMSFHRQDLLRRHAKTHEGHTSDTAVNVESKDRHCCSTCGETFAEALALLAHAEIHARYPPFKCVLCGESFFEEHTIKRHLKAQHANEMTSNSCILCGKECRDRKALIKHAWDHSREKCHSCSKCGKNFHNKARLKRHMSSHRDKSVMCDVCHEEFPDGRSLSNHRHSHSISASGKLFPCHECGKTFGSRSSQQIHVRIHTGERPYGCHFCWKAFADGGTLRKHERIHTGEKPYVCAVCPRAFNQRVVLREHIRSHHSGLDAKRGTYFCSVCNEELSSSSDLMQHLIQHSDVNTARQRQPIAGPRKYKRRRKLKPHEIARLRSESKRNGGTGSDIELSDFDMNNVDELLGVTETITAPMPITTTKPGNKSRRGGKQKNSADSAGGNGEESMDEAGGVAGASNSENPDGEKFWQTKLINSTSSVETYKSLLSNLENTLQSIDSLVVGSRHDVNAQERASKSTAQRTQQVRMVKAEPKFAGEVSARTRKKAEKSKAAVRPRMIHTQKCRNTVTDGKRRVKSYITRTEPANLELLAKSTSLVDDYEIISPDIQPPNQISSSPLHVKQEAQAHHTSMTSQCSSASRSGDLYDAQLLLEASTLRRGTLEKFNPSIVNDLEEILRSPLKCEKTERHRFTSESSTQFLVEPSEEEQHLIKIEPISPDLREIVSGSMGSGVVDIGVGSSMKRRSTRRTRQRLTAGNRKYMAFETELDASLPGKNTTSRHLSHATNKNKTNITQCRDPAAISGQPSSSATVYLPYNLNNYDSNADSSATPSRDSSTFARIDNVMSTDTAISSTLIHLPQPERKQRFFECEMCSAVFPDRAQLLDHVPIHI